MGAESIALELLRTAAVVFPPLAALLRELVSKVPAGEPLVDKVRAILPADGASADAVRELERRHGHGG